MLRFGVGGGQSGEDPDIRQLEEQIARTGQQIEMLKQRRRERLAGDGGASGGGGHCGGGDGNGVTWVRG